MRGPQISVPFSCSLPLFLSSSISLSLALEIPYRARVRTCTPRADPNPYHHRVGRPQLWGGRYQYRGSPRPHRRDMGRSRFSRPPRPGPRVHFPRVSLGFAGFRWVCTHRMGAKITQHGPTAQRTRSVRSRDLAQPPHSRGRPTRWRHGFRPAAPLYRRISKIRVPDHPSSPPVGAICGLLQVQEASNRRGFTPFST